MSPLLCKKHEQNYVDVTQQQAGKYTQESGNISFLHVLPSV